MPHREMGHIFEKELKIINANHKKRKELKIINVVESDVLA